VQVIGHLTGDCVRGYRRGVVPADLVQHL